MTLRMIAVAAALGLAAYAAPAAAQTAAKPMNYDCTKAGNKNKAACKNVVAPAMAPVKAVKTAPMAPLTPVKAVAPAKPMNYDCTKAGNKNKTACKNVVPGGVPAVAAVKPVAAPAPFAKPAPAPMTPAKVRAAAAPKPVNPNLVAATLKNGKVVHYDCTKKGNLTKTACKK